MSSSHSTLPAPAGSAEDPLFYRSTILTIGSGEVVERDSLQKVPAERGGSIRRPGSFHTRKIVKIFSFGERCAIFLRGFTSTSAPKIQLKIP